MKINKGDHVVVEVPITYEETGEAFDLTDFEVEFNAVGVSKKITKTVGSGIEITDPATGIIKLTLTPEDNDTVGVFRYGLRVKKDDKPLTIDISTYEVLPDENV